MNLVLPDAIRSPDQLSLCLQELRKLVSKQRDASARAHVAAKPAEPPSPSPDVQALLLANKLVEASDIEAVIPTLEQLRANAPAVHVTLAALPGSKLAAQLASWFRAEIHPHTLITFIMNRQIGGGVIVRAGSHVYDFSFNSQLARQKDKLAEIFARV